MRDSAPESHCWEFKVVSFEPDGRIRYQSKVDFASRIRDVFVSRVSHGAMVGVDVAFLGRDPY